MPLQDRKIPLGRKPLTVYVPDTRGVQISRYGMGNLKIGPNVFTYSKLPGHPDQFALGSQGFGPPGTCPGASSWCLANCYASRPVRENGVVAGMWRENSIAGENVPPIPEECRLLRIHVGGDFDSVAYVEAWIARLKERPDVTCWAYTRSWRVAELLPALERLRALPNVQLFASMDKSIRENPPAGWRVAWVDGDERLLQVGVRSRGSIVSGAMGYVCPEETGHKKNCEECRYCFDGRKNDVVFLEH